MTTNKFFIFTRTIDGVEELDCRHVPDRITEDNFIQELYPHAIFPISNVIDATAWTIDEVAKFLTKTT